MEFSTRCLHPRVQGTHLSRNLEKRRRMRKCVQYGVRELTVVSRAEATSCGLLLAGKLDLVNHDPRQWRHQTGRTMSATGETGPPLLLLGNMLGLYKYFIRNLSHEGTTISVASVPKKVHTLDQCFSTAINYIGPREVLLEVVILVF